MNEVIRNILSRKSIREFSDREIPKKELELIVRAAESAPSGRNCRTWKFTIIRDKEIKNKLRAAVSNALCLGDDYDFYRPDILIIASNKKDNQLGVADCSCALENIFLAAHSLGIGSVWINQFRTICDKPEVRKVLDGIKIPQDHIIVGCAALGYSAEEHSLKIRSHPGASEWFL